MVLNHERYAISHPFEWPSKALKNAALYHLKLLQDLDGIGLTLKDALPDNIAFTRGAPRFVDFLSLIQIEDLAEEDWLLKHRRNGEDLRHCVLRTMFVPFFLIPLLAFAIDRPRMARKRLRTQACRMARSKTVPVAAIGNLRPQRALWLLSIVKRYRAAERLAPPECFSEISKIIRSIRFRSESGYANYYEKKGESFDLEDKSQLREKQTSVYHALQIFGGGSVLDVGANTGWFSFLAVEQGYTVTSYEIDEVALNILFEVVERQSIPVTPVHCSWGAVQRTIGVNGKSDRDTTFFSSPLDWHKSEVTMMLGLLHHLTLGENRSFDQIFRAIAHNCTKGAIVEFVDLADPLVAGNPGYFRSRRKWDRNSYNIDEVIKAASLYFDQIEEFSSHPSTRKIIKLRKIRHC